MVQIGRIRGPEQKGRGHCGSGVGRVVEEEMEPGARRDAAAPCVSSPRAIPTTQKTYPIENVGRPSTAVSYWRN
jgi:hypothetical protein